MMKTKKYACAAGIVNGIVSSSILIIMEIFDFLFDFLMQWGKKICIVFLYFFSFRSLRFEYKKDRKKSFICNKLCNKSQ